MNFVPDIGRLAAARGFNDASPVLLHICCDWLRLGFLALTTACHWMVASRPVPAENATAMSETPKCAKCGSSMEEGFILDLGDADFRAGQLYVTLVDERYMNSLAA